MEVITKYFPDLTPQQVEAFKMLFPLYAEWNEKINVVSRKDIDNLYVNHILHSLAIAKIIQFTDGTRVLDVGTGGGFPGIPLAILFPQCHFHLIDSIGKKINVVNGVIDSLGLKNAKGEHIRVQQVKGRYDFVVSRAVTRFDDFYTMVRHTIHTKNNNSLSNGIIYLKGGDFSEEISAIKQPMQVFTICDYINEPFFETKKIIHLAI